MSTIKVQQHRDMCTIFITQKITSFETINLLAPEKGGRNFTSMFFKLNSQIDITSTSCEIGLR